MLRLVPHSKYRMSWSHCGVSSWTTERTAGSSLSDGWSVNYKQDCSMPNKVLIFVQQLHWIENKAALMSANQYQSPFIPATVPWCSPREWVAWLKEHFTSRIENVCWYFGSSNGDVEIGTFSTEKMEQDPKEKTSQRKLNLQLKCCFQN